MSGTRPKVVCLLPARNCEADLAGWFNSVVTFADAVVALDDGSDDGTRRVLEAHSLVEILLANPPREGYAGWDDGENRNALLQAASALSPDWIISLDADERIDADDAHALREFIDRDAIPAFAYGFRVYRMIDDDSHYDRADVWVYRLFGFREGQRFRDDRLHFVPVPTDIPRARWLKTTVRIQHLAGQTAERRQSRFAKYLEVDADRASQPNYGHLLDPPGRVHRWKPRERETPILAGSAEMAEGNALSDAPMLDLDRPLLSAIVISQNDEDRIVRTVRSVVSQECDDPFEVIVVTSGTDRTADLVREHFPHVTLVELPRPALPGEARNAGLRVARGDYISFPGSHVELAPGSLAARIRAHERGYAMVTGTTMNGTRTAAGWASYFLDHTTVLAGRPSGVLPGPPAHCSYTREALDVVGAFPEDMRAGEDTVVNRALTRAGFATYRAADARLFHHSSCTTPSRLLRHHFVRGRALGRIYLTSYPAGLLLSRPILEGLIVSHLPARIRRIDSNVARWGSDVADVYARVRPLVMAGAAASWVGTLFELLRPAPGKAQALLGSPADAVDALRRRWSRSRRPASRSTSPFRSLRRGARARVPIEVNAYVPLGVERLARSEVVAILPRLSYVSLFSYAARADGGLDAPPDEAIRNAARAAGTTPLMVLTNTEDGRFEPRLAHDVLASGQTREKLADAAVEAAAARGFGGLNVDFENVPEEDRDAYTALLELLADRLKRDGLSLSTALAPKTGPEQTGPWHAGHDYAAHGRIADFVVLMTYVWGISTGPARAVAPLKDVRRVLDYATSEIEPAKILLGVPLYGYDWVLSDTPTAPRARTLTLDEAPRLADAYDATVKFDQASQSPWFEYNAADGERHVVWYEDRASLEAKFDLVRQFGLRGVSYWRLPLAATDNWRLLGETFDVIKHHDDV